MIKTGTFPTLPGFSVSRLLILTVVLLLTSCAGYFSPPPKETKGDDAGQSSSLPDCRSRHHVIICDWGESV